MFKLNNVKLSQNRTLNKRSKEINETCNDLSVKMGSKGNFREDCKGYFKGYFKG